MMESEGKMTTTDARGWIAALIKAMHEETSGSWPDPEYKDEVYSALEMAIRTLENHDIFMKRAYSQGKQDTLSQEPCDDAVSREAVVQTIEDAKNAGELTFARTIKRIMELPPVTQKSETVTEFADRCRECGKMRKGHWIYDETINNWRCSKCNETPKTMGYVGTADFMAEHFKFCNHCGRRMVKSQESEDKK